MNRENTLIRYFSPEIFLFSQQRLNRFLSYPEDYQPEQEITVLISEAEQLFLKHVKPALYAVKINIGAIEDHSIYLADGRKINCKILANRLAASNSNYGVIAALTLGQELEDVISKAWQDARPDQAFFLNAFGSGAMELFLQHVKFHICEWADKKNLMTLPSYSPGYRGWDIAEQSLLFEIIREHLREQLPLEILDSHMIKPEKSMLAFLGMTADQSLSQKNAYLIPCYTCDLVKCAYRRLPRRENQFNAV